MKSKDIAAALFLVVVIAGLGYLWLTPSGAKSAPQVTFTTLQGEQLPMQNYRGKPLMVVFWATTCPGCIKEMPHLVELYEEMHSDGLSIVGVAMDYDPPKQVAEMVRERQLPYTIAHDGNGSIAKAFGDVKLTPTTFLIDPKGRIVQQTLGELNMPQLRQRIGNMINRQG